MPRPVLLIDDTPEIAELLTYALAEADYQAHVSGYDYAINNLVREVNAQAVILDCSTLDVNESLFDTLRDDPAHQRLPVVIVTDTPEDAVAMLRARQATHVLLVPKPFTGSQVVAALEQLLEG